MSVVIQTKIDRGKKPHVRYVITYGDYYVHWGKRFSENPGY